MSKEYKISVPKWVLNEKIPVQSKRMESVIIDDLDGDGKLSRGDMLVRTDRSGDMIFEEFEGSVHDKAALKRFGIGDARNLDLKFAEAYFGRVRQTAKLAAKGRVSGEEVIEAILPRIERGAQYLEAYYGVHGIDRPSALVAQVKAGALEVAQHRHAKATQWRKQMLSLYSTRSAHNPKTAERYWEVSAQARKSFEHYAKTSGDDFWQKQVEWVLKMDQKAYGQSELSRMIPEKHENYLALNGYIEHKPWEKSQQQLRREAAKADYDQFMSRRVQLEADFDAL